MQLKGLKQGFSRTILFSAITLALSGVAQADTTIDMVVSYWDTFDNTVAKQAAISTSIANMGAAIYEATNGVHKIGKITVFTDGAMADRADIVWRNDKGDSGANCWFNAHVGGRGKAGQRIQHCDVGGGDPERYNMLTTKKVAGGFVLAHEMGHFFYAMYDEYGSSTVCNPDRVSSPCAGDVAILGSIMNTTWAATDANDVLVNPSVLNFSTSKTNSTATNAQFRAYGGSAWDTLVKPIDQDPAASGRWRTYFADLVAVAPAAGQDPSVELQPIANDNSASFNKSIAGSTIEFKPGSAAPAVAAAMRSRSAGGDTFANSFVTASGQIPPVRVLVVDVSNATTAADLTMVKTALIDLAHRTEAGVRLALVTLDGGVAKVAVAPVIVTDTGAPASLTDAIHKLSLSTKPSALGDALVDLTKQVPGFSLDQKSMQSVYLFTNGFYQSGINLSGAGTELRKLGLAVYGFALSTADESSSNALEAMAGLTRGQFYPGGKTSLLNEALQLADEASAPAVSAELIADVASIAGTKDLAFSVDAGLADIDVTVDLETVLSNVSVSLLDPSGKATAANCQAEDPAIVTAQEVQCTLTVASPAVGAWKLRILNNGAAADTHYAVHAVPKANVGSISAEVRMEKRGGDTRAGTPVILTASVGGDMPIAGVTVTSTVTDQDGNKTTVILKDDGVAPDMMASDGTYSGSFTPTKNGTYTVKAQFDNSGGKGSYSSNGIEFVPFVGGGTPEKGLIPTSKTFVRSARSQIQVKSTIADYDRVMNWAESVLPGYFPLANRQTGVVSTFKVRYYATTNIYLGYNTTDGQYYVLGKEFGPAALPIGGTAKWLPLAAAANF